MKPLLLALLAAGTLSAQPKTYPPPGYKLVWSDDFSGSHLDVEKWMYRTDVKMESSQRAENVAFADGNLAITLKKEAHRGKQYTGGGVISKRRFQYGYYEARVRMHGGAGWHQSVWAMYAGDGATTFPDLMRTEIDGMEFDSDVPWKGHMGLIKWEGPGKKRAQTCTPAFTAAHSGSMLRPVFMFTASNGPKRPSASFSTAICAACSPTPPRTASAIQSTSGSPRLPTRSRPEE